jgi:hypothetical protein
MYEIFTLSLGDVARETRRGVKSENFDYGESSMHDILLWDETNNTLEASKAIGNTIDKNLSVTLLRLSVEHRQQTGLSSTCKFRND